MSILGACGPNAPLRQQAYLPILGTFPSRMFLSRPTRQLAEDAVALMQRSLTAHLRAESEQSQIVQSETGVFRKQVSIGTKQKSASPSPPKGIPADRQA